MPDEKTIKKFPHPMNMSTNAEAEDLFDAKDLLNIFNNTFRKRPAFSFVPLAYIEFQEAQNRLKDENKEFGWVATMKYLIRRTTDKPTFDLPKHELALGISKAIRNNEINLPVFYTSTIQNLARYLQDHK